MSIGELFGKVGMLFAGVFIIAGIIPIKLHDQWRSGFMWAINFAMVVMIVLALTVHANMPVRLP